MLRFNRTLGLDSAKASLSQALSSGKFPHALLVHGPEGVGQNPLLLDLVDLLICEDAATRPCGECAGCLGRKRNNLDNLLFIMPLEKKEKAASEGEMEGAQVDELASKAKEFHDDPYGFSRTEKSRINIAQIRDLQNQLSFTEAEGRPRIVVILWAETMPQEAANALLKTLEEPPANTYFLLSSDDRGALLPTIVSRCTQLACFPLERDNLVTVLAAHGRALDLETIPTRLLPFADGSPGVLLTLHRHGGEALLEEARCFLDAAFNEDWRAFADYLEGSDAFADMETTARLINFLLRMLRLFHRLEILEGPAQGMPAPAGLGIPAANFTWTAEALRRQQFDPELATYLGPLENVSDLEALAGWLEQILSAVQSYAKPKVAALGLFLDFETNQARKAAHPC